MTPRRFGRLKQTLDRRQPDLTVLLEGVHKPHNFSAVLRSCDAVGVHEAHIVPGIEGVPLVSGTAQGSHKWVHVRRHHNMEDGVQLLRDSGHKLYAAHLSEDAIPYRELDFTGPCAFIMGTEKHGLSAASLELVDQIITIPMHGMVASLNVSVAAALLLFEAQQQRLSAGMYNRARLPAREYDHVLFEWAHPKIARHCRDRKLPYPRLDEDGNILDAVPGISEP